MSHKYPWQLTQSLDAVVFDCDATLSRLEGIDELAVQNGVGDSVKALTHQAMSSTGVTPELYEKRMSLVQPKREQVAQLGEDYYAQRTPDVNQVIAILQRLGKQVFIMSAGFKPAVDIFATHFHVPTMHVYAVDVRFDADGNYVDFDKESPLARPGGKSHLIQQIKQQYPAVMHIGDGMNDVDVKADVARFVGYGGVAYRESILAHCDFYLLSVSMLPVLALALTQEEVDHLSEADRVVYDAGVSLVLGPDVILK